MPRTQLVFAVNSFGKSWSGWMASAMNLRKGAFLEPYNRHCFGNPASAGPRCLAEAEATTHELMSVSGHWTLAQLQVYTEKVNRKKLADSRDQ
jgi:hypothetical protein